MPTASYVAVVERAEPLLGEWATEPYEVAWAREAVYFMVPRAPVATTIDGRVQMSPDGIHWADEGSTLSLVPGASTAFVRVSAFGGWLRLSGLLPDGAEAKVLIYLCLKE